MIDAIHLLLSLSTLVVSTPRALPFQEPARLLDAQRAGLGDAKALASLGVVESRGKLVFEGFTGEGDYRELLAPDGASRLEAYFEGAPPSQTCTNGELFWMTGTGGVELKKGWSAAADARLFAFGRNREWRDMYAGAELVGEAEVAGRACRELRLTPKSPTELGIEAVPGEEPPAPDVWWLDQSSNELVQIAIYATASGAGWQRLVLRYWDWRPVAGVRFPFQSSTSFGPPEHPLTIRFTRASLDVDAKVAPGVFQPDEPVFRELAKSGARAAPLQPEFKLEQRPSSLTAAVRVRCKHADVQKQLAILLPEVMAYLGRERIAPVGPPFARFHSIGEPASGEPANREPANREPANREPANREPANREPANREPANREPANRELVELEAGIPVAQAIAGHDRVKPSSLPGGNIVTGIHVGPYDALPRTHEAMGRWLEDRKLAVAGGPWEIFWTDPGLQRDPSKWRTEIHQPVTAESAAAARAASDADTGAALRINGTGYAPAAERDARLTRLGNLAVGAWKVEGGADGPHGTVVFEWLEGGHFLVQHVDLVHGEHEIKGVEIIGRERPFGAEVASTELKSRFYDNLGNTLDYVWEFEGRELTIWSGQVGSPASYHGTFSADGNTLTGGWRWPGGGFDLVGTRILATANTGE